MKLLQILVLMTVFVVFANAQKAVLSGTVYDSQGAVILGTKVYATNANGQKVETIVNTDGNYLFELLVGIYTIEFNAVNFERVRFKDYQITNSSKGKMYLDVSLSPTNNSIIDVLTAEPPRNNKRKINKKLSNKFIKRK